jgi:amidase
MKIRIIIESLSMPAVDPRVLKLFLASAERFKAVGVSVEEVSNTFHKQGAAIWTGISKFGGFYVTKTGSNTGRRGHAMNELNAKRWPLAQERWDNTYPKSVRCLLGQVSVINLALVRKYLLRWSQWSKDLPSLLSKAINLSRKLQDDYSKALHE